MASVNSYSVSRMKQIEDESVVSGFVDLSGNLLLEKRNGETFSAGNIQGPQGDPGADYQFAAGFVQEFAGSVPPSGWMICNGAELLRSAYPELFLAIGTTYGTSGPLYFNIPDLRGKVIVGHDPSQTEFINLGKTGGAKTHTLTIAQMPSHSHTVATRTGLDDSNFSFNGGVSSDRNDVGPAFSTGSEGGGGAHNNLQPYNTLNYIISIGTGVVGGGSPIPVGQIGTGSTAERDALFGVPGTDAQRVALANMKPIWWNTTTNRLETYYALANLSGLAVPGLWTSGAFANGWYAANATDWAGKSGPSAWTATYKATWARGVDSGGVLNASNSVFGVTIGLTGIYECTLSLRGGAAGNGEYGALALNGDRTAFENRSTNVPITGVWTHDHPAATNNFSTSFYLGQLIAGDLITGGPASTAYGMPTGTAASSGLLSVKRVA